MKNRRGQAMLEMVFLLPLLIGIIGGGMFLVYTAWQGIRVQQAANFAARIQGQERVSGGTEVGEIDNENGAGVGTGDTVTMDSSDPDHPLSHGSVNQPAPESVYGKFYFLIKDKFFSKSQQVIIPQPVIGQNVDRVSVIRLIKVPDIPFLKKGTLPSQVKVQGTAWGGEDTYMYALPRWGKTGSGTAIGSSSDPEWKQLAKDQPNHD